MSSLYLHIPFCVKRCAYCDFYSQVADVAVHEHYVKTLLRHLQLVSEQPLRAGVLDTIYFGGGTPSVLQPQHFAALLGACEKLLGIAGDCEITVEVNPGTVDELYLRHLRDLGVNRISMGIQSFDAPTLEQLGRCHSPREGLAAIAAARAAGFDNLSLDLMFALPGQGLAAVEQDVKLLLEQEPEHLSVYGLTYEEGTDFFERLQADKLQACDEDLYAQQYELIRARLGAAGYEHYELANFARPGFRCRHNQVYWQRRDCLAIGAGAHSFTSRGYGERWAVPPDIAGYLAALGAGNEPAECLEAFDKTTAMKEALYLALRTKDGLDLEQFSNRFGCRAEVEFADALKKLAGSLRTTPKKICLEPENWLIYDCLVSYFL